MNNFGLLVPPNYQIFQLLVGAMRFVQPLIFQFLKKMKMFHHLVPQYNIYPPPDFNLPNIAPYILIPLLHQLAFEAKWEQLYCHYIQSHFIDQTDLSHKSLLVALNPIKNSSISLSIIFFISPITAYD